MTTKDIQHSARQIRGFDCIMCGRELSEATAVNLKPQPVTVADLRLWRYPRACPGECAKRAQGS